MMKDIPFKSALTVSGETSMTACAQLLARQLQAGDCLLLSGTLGAGKTTFARGIVRTLCGTETEVVSPTFMLVQHYDALAEQGGFMVQHYDLYRLKHPDELWELGVDEALGHALVLVEWPEIAQDHWPADRMEISIEHDTANNRCRRLHVAAYGAMVAKANTFCRLWETALHD
jgi:tRNA threonylcarbamoyl adenosine modification protein YjeE